MSEQTPETPSLIDRLNQMAEELRLDDKEREQFVKSSMERAGYRPRIEWDPPEADPNQPPEEPGDFFTPRRQQRQERQQQQQQPPQPPRQAAAPYPYN